MGIRYQTLVEHFKKDAAGASTALRESFKNKDVRPEDFDLGRLFEECYGFHAFKACRNKEMLASDVILAEAGGRLSSMRFSEDTRLEEAAGAVTTSHFQNISGQIAYSATLQAYETEATPFSDLITEVQATYLEGEKMAGVTELGDEIVIRPETEPYALAGPGENWVFTPPILDRGVIVPVTWEAVFSDRTGQLLDRCRDVGKWMKINKEKRAIDAVIDENTTAHRYNWRNSGQIATYGDNSGSHTWDNLVSSNALVDHTDIDAVMQAFNGLVDPFTGEPIAIEPRHIVAVNALEMTVKRVLNSTIVRTNIGGYPVSGNPAAFEQANPFANAFQPVISRRLAGRLATDTDWFVGNITALVKYMVAERMNVVQAPPNNHDEFHRRIVFQNRVNERGQHVVVEPRAMVKSTSA